jgi:hypothetical protein
MTPFSSALPDVAGDARLRGGFRLDRRDRTRPGGLYRLATLLASPSARIRDTPMARLECGFDVYSPRGVRQAQASLPPYPTPHPIPITEQHPCLYVASPALAGVGRLSGRGRRRHALPQNERRPSEADQFETSTSPAASPRLRCRRLSGGSSPDAADARSSAWCEGHEARRHPKSRMRWPRGTRPPKAPAAGPGTRAPGRARADMGGPGLVPRVVRLVPPVLPVLGTAAG